MVGLLVELAEREFLRLVGAFEIGWNGGDETTTHERRCGLWLEGFFLLFLSMVNKCEKNSSDIIYVGVYFLLTEFNNNR